MKLTRSLFLPMFLLAFVSGASAKQPVDCMDLNPTGESLDETIENFVACIEPFIQPASPLLYVIPDAAAQTAWQNEVEEMLAGTCDGTVSADLPGYTQFEFTDVPTARTYCVLFETQTDPNKPKYVDRGWGTFITDAGFVRELHLQAIHPGFDSATPQQAVGTFKGIRARSLYIAGADRRAHADMGCSGNETFHTKADPSHESTGMAQQTAIAIAGFYTGTSTDWHLVQFHSQSSCGDVWYLTYGRGTVTGSSGLIEDFEAAIRAEYNVADSAVLLAGESCPTGAAKLTATRNVTGRFLNGVAAGSVCSNTPSSASERFIHIEGPNGIAGSKDAAHWIAILTAVFP